MSYGCYKYIGLFPSGKSMILFGRLEGIRDEVKDGEDEDKKGWEKKK